MLTSWGYLWGYMLHSQTTTTTTSDKGFVVVVILNIVIVSLLYNSLSEALGYSILQSRQDSCLKMFVLHKTHHQLLNSVTLIHKWSMSNIRTHGQLLHHLL